MGGDDDGPIEILLKQYDITSAEIRGAGASLDRLMSFALLVLGAGLTYGIAGNEPSKWYVLVVLPLPLLAIANYYMDKLFHLATLGGHKQALESAVNQRVGENLLTWEHASAPVYQGGLPQKLLPAAYGSFLAVAVWLSWHAGTKLPPADATTMPTLRTVAILTTILGIGLLVSGWKLLSVRARSESRTKEAMARRPDPAAGSASEEKSAPAAAPPGTHHR